MDFAAATMKYFAILKDSLREALDSKVLYVLFGLSLLMIFFVATIGFRPLPAEKTLSKVVDGAMGMVLEALKPEAQEGKRKKARDNKDNPFLIGEPSPYRLEKATLLRGTTDAPDADYTLTLSKMFLNEESADKVRQDPAAEMQAIRKHFAKSASIPDRQASRSMSILRWSSCQRAACAGCGYMSRACSSASFP
jgi:hypothetical protein